MKQMVCDQNPSSCQKSNEELSLENTRLKNMVAELYLNNLVLEAALRDKANQQ